MMKRIIPKTIARQALLLASIAALATVLIYLKRGHAPFGFAHNDFQVEIALDKNTYRLGDDLKCYVLLQNRSGSNAEIRIASIGDRSIRITAEKYGITYFAPLFDVRPEYYTNSFVRLANGESRRILELSVPTNLRERKASFYDVTEYEGGCDSYGVVIPPTGPKDCLWLGRYTLAITPSVEVKGQQGKHVSFRSVRFKIIENPQTNPDGAP